MKQDFFSPRILHENSFPLPFYFCSLKQFAVFRVFRVFRIFPTGNEGTLYILYWPISAPLQNFWLQVADANLSQTGL